MKRLSIVLPLLLSATGAAYPQAKPNIRPKKSGHAARPLMALPGHLFRYSASIQATGSCWAIPDPFATFGLVAFSNAMALI
jgi:hypothetical protein